VPTTNEFAALRYDAMLLRQQREPLPVHVIVAQTERPGEIIIEMLPLERRRVRTARSA
jgi:two-component system nitrogen regulation sensor histidine kinase GlnL